MKALIHCTTFLEIGSFLLNSIPPTTFHPTIVVARRNWEVQIPLYFLSFPTTFCIFFRLGKPKKFTTVCIPTDGNFPIFENSTLSSRRKSDFIFPCIFSRIRYTVTFCELWPYVIPFHSSVELQLTWSTFPKKIVKFPGRQIACIINKKISFTMLSVSVFLLWCKNTQDF